MPPGFAYQTDLLSSADERQLVSRLANLSFKEFQFQGYVGKRRVVSFGWQYDFNQKRLGRTDDIPPFLLALRTRAAKFAGILPAQLQQVLVTEYPPGAGIGWHRDKSIFGQVIGVSLVSPCLFRLRQKIEQTWRRASIILEPRSAYLLQGPSRTHWQHSIPSVDSLRYSITFRNFKSGDMSDVGLEP